MREKTLQALIKAYFFVKFSFLLVHNVSQCVIIQVIGKERHKK